MARLDVRPEAELDAQEAGSWYEGERVDLGAKFLLELCATFVRIEQAPLQFPLVSGDIRRAILHRFPFGVFFIEEGDVATVLAITHLHRHPGTWQSRR
ncbi:MAG: type II toxin-antitoxin system RelE/ParE family toxin [Vicinamibacterales bacterium]